MCCGVESGVTQGVDCRLQVLFGLACELLGLAQCGHDVDVTFGTARASCLVPPSSRPRAPGISASIGLDKSMNESCNFLHESVQICASS